MKFYTHLGIMIVATKLKPGEKPLIWVGSSKSDLLAFPEDVKDEIGNALGIAQLGGKHPKAKPWKGEGSGVFEIVDDYDGDTYRAVYTVRFERGGLRASRLSKEIAVRDKDGPAGQGTC